ncbi:Protein SERAC1 [Apiospora sp. TS-2023a]
MYKAEMEVLLHAGADINLTDKEGDTALTVACMHDDDETVRVLLDHGADMLHANQFGKTALQIALEKEATDCLQILVERTGKLFAALKSAVERGNMAVASVVRSVEASKQGLDYGDGVVLHDEPKQQDDHSNAQDGTTGVSNTESRRPGMLQQVSEELKSALGTQISLYQQFSPGYPDNHQDEYKSATPHSATQPPRFSSQAGPGWQQWPGSPGLQQSPPLPSSSTQVPQSEDVPAGLSIPSPPIRRKPAPVTPSPPPSLAPGRPPKQYAPQQQQSPPSSSQPFMAYNPNASPPPPSSASYFPSQQSTGTSGTPPPIAPKPAEYTTQSSGYYSHIPGTGSGNNNYSGEISGGNPHTPPSQPQQQRQSSYYPVGQNPYSGWDAAQQQQPQHQQQQQQQRPQGRRSGLRCWIGRD